MEELTRRIEIAVDLSEYRVFVSVFVSVCVCVCVCAIFAKEIILPFNGLDFGCKSCCKKNLNKNKNKPS